jgi:hypothetical protein
MGGLEGERVGLKRRVRKTYKIPVNTLRIPKLSMFPTLPVKIPPAKCLKLDESVLVDGLA